MKTTPIVAVLVAGSALSLSACNGKVEPTTNPPVPVIEPTGNPPPPTPPAGNPPPPLPSWDEVGSGHPEGATNPPIPYLYVTPDGDCFKAFVSPFRAGGPDGLGDRVREDCAGENCGVSVECPDRAQGLLDAYNARPVENTEDGPAGE